MNSYIYLFSISLLIFITKLNADTIYVSTSGSDETGDGSVTNPFMSIQKGIDEAASMDTVYVTNGIYEGGVVIENTTISLIGESREETKINQPISAPQISIIECPETVRVENFIIKRGSSDDGGGIFSYESMVEVKNVDFSQNFSYGNGAAINSFASEVIVHNSTFSSNTSDGLGGAIFVDPLTVCEIYNSSFDNNGALWGGAIATVGGGKLLVDGSNITFNTASGNNSNPDYDYPTFGGGGGIYQEWSDSLEIYDTQILNNTAATGAGGGIAVYLSNDITIDNIILNNNSSSGPQDYPSGGGGAAFYRADNVLFENSTIANNVSNDNSGGGIFFGSESGEASIVVHATFNRLTLVNNSALSGGAIFCWSAILNLYNSTLAQNEASNSEWSGGGLASHYVTEPNIVNSLFYDNIPNSIHNGYQQTPVIVAHSLLQEEWTGEGNLIDVDPLFTDPQNEDFSLLQTSPCIDAGTSDVDGDGFDDNLFFTGSAPDMGALEWVIAAPQDLQAYPQESTVILAWSPITEAQYYQLDRATNETFTENAVQSFVTTNSFTDESLEPEIEYFYRVSGYVGYYTDYSNTVSVIIESLDLDNSFTMPLDYKIHQNYPNPFNPITTLSYDLPEASPVRIAIYDMMGKMVKNLLNDYQDAGLRSIKWDATNDQGKQVSAGMYIYRIEIGDFKQSKKMLFIK